MLLFHVLVDVSVGRQKGRAALLRPASLRTVYVQYVRISDVYFLVLGSTAAELPPNAPQYFVETAAGGVCYVWNSTVLKILHGLR